MNECPIIKKIQGDNPIFELWNLSEKFFYWHYLAYACLECLPANRVEFSNRTNAIAL